jgi:tripartite-type tricarboxylate transporter receptor subunit TctC
MTEWRRLWALLGVLCLSAAPAFAQGTFPSHQVTVLVPYPAGGAVDIVARTLGQELEKNWGKPVVIENRPGAGGVIASQALVKSAPDGHTLIVVASGHAINPFLYAKLPYDTFADFTPISLLASSPNMLLVRADSPFKSVADLLAAARAKPGSLSYGMSGNGTSTHLAGELFKYLAKVDIAAVPYKGGAPILNDLIGGHIPLSFNNIPESIGQVRGGALRPLGVTTKTRSPVLPDVPTIAEAGVPGYDTGVWWGLLGPAKLSPEITAKLHADIVAALGVATVKSRLADLGAVPVGNSPQEFSALIRADYDTWGPVIKAAGIKSE